MTYKCKTLHKETRNEILKSQEREGEREQKNSVDRDNCLVRKKGEKRTDN